MQNWCGYNLSEPHFGRALQTAHQVALTYSNLSAIKRQDEKRQGLNWFQFRSPSCCHGIRRHFTIKNTVIHFIMYLHSTWGHTTISTIVCKEYDKSLNILFYFLKLPAMLSTTRGAGRPTWLGRHKWPASNDEGWPGPDYWLYTLSFGIRPPLFFVLFFIFSLFEKNSN